MLSLRGVPPRQGGVEELEEGEACPNGDGEAPFDPDVALSYIDEKLQYVLGHFQKDFEGGVSAANLGSKFGGYGSFLPTYQRSPPLLPQSRSPYMAANISTSRSPYQPSAEIMDQNPSIVAVESISRNNGSGAPSTSDLLEKEKCSSTDSEELVVGSDSLDSSFTDSDSKSLEVRAKVCSNNALPTKYAAIYSGLGLDISSSSSMEESPDGLGGLSPEFSNAPCESPRTILQIMTCFPVPGGFLLSPLHCNVLQLINKVTPLLKKWETHLDMENVPRAFEGRSQSSVPPGHVRGHVAKQLKSGSKKKIPMDAKATKDKGDTSAIVNKEVNIEMPASQEVISDMPAPTTAIKSESQFAQESTKNTCMPSQQNENVRFKEQIGGNDMATVKAEEIKAKATKYTEDSGFDNSRTGNLAPKGKPKIKMGKVDIDLEERDMSNHKSSSFDMKRRSKVKAERKFEAAIVDCEYNENKNKDWGVEPCDDLRNFPVRKNFSSNRTEYDNPRTEVKKMHKESQVSAAASYDLTEDDNCAHSSATIMDRTNYTQLKSCHFEKKAKSHKDLGENLPNRCQGDMEGALLENRRAQGEVRQKEKIMNTNKKNDFDVDSARKEIPTHVKHRELHMPSTIWVATSNADPVPTPALIKDHWVLCDVCQKWRLLPYGMNPSMLPKKWKCSMLYWLPGMNRCDISENETTYALNALYVIRVPAASVSSGGPHAARDTAISSACNISGQLEQSRKRKTAPCEGNDLIESSKHTPFSTLMSNQQDPRINERTTDSKHYSFERDSGSKHGLRPVSKSADLVSEKQKSKHKNHSSYSAGDLMERARAHSKIKKKIGIAQDEQKTYKKTKKGDHHQMDRELRETLPPRQALDVAEHNGRDVVCQQFSTAATLSSSKISSSRKNKKSQEAKDSPVESVSSSPLRTFNIEKLSHARKNGTVNGPVRYPNFEVSVLDNGQQAGNFEGSQAPGPIFHGSLQGSSDSNNKEIAQSACAEVSDITRSERGLGNNLPKASRRKDLTVNDTGVGTGDHQLCSGDKKGLDMECPSPQPGLFDGRATTFDTVSDPIAHGSKNIETRQGSGSGHQLGMSFGKEKSHLRTDYQNIQNPVAQIVNLPMTEGKQNTSVKSDLLKMKAKSMSSNIENGVQHVTVKQAISNPSYVSPMRKDGSMVAFALKEARDLKHKANDLKNKGQELGSTDLYFEAALKFLHVAFLLETPSSDSLRPGDAAQSMKMYSETAKLCNFCAHEYERCKKMASAALAYKCVEVAYLKAAYYKHPSASKDRHELQAAVQIAPGESPSPSASDINNLNGHGLSKAPSTRDGNSLQVAGNHFLLPVHNQAHLLRLLTYTNDVNCAFNATRKSEVAIASAAGSQESGKSVDDDLASVKAVLDLSFNNVNELLGLVRLSMESINS